MIAIVDYGLGNVRAIGNIYKRLDIPVRLATTADELRSADKVVLPGVGAFDWAMSRLNASGMRSCLDELVMHDRRPVLGICVGMQMMGRGSDEGALEGLGWIDGMVKKLDGGSPRAQLPHMGWNDVAPCEGDGLFKGLEGPRFYFLHSYYFVPGADAVVLATTDYGREFASSVRSGNTRGVQFHPEKSHTWGVQLLTNFAEL